MAIFGPFLTKSNKNKQTHFKKVNGDNSLKYIARFTFAKFILSAKTYFSVLLCVVMMNIIGFGEE
jgi:hypothetical protein